ncbi:KIR-like CYIR protein [Plasmodium cynomolgi strain B]|uniref:KIR-like CYIR protein n=1 Tax=Plasmodium cynomolgi (strain B) TaxID=1120755 RepID=K6UI04_PLACD|nr:KIR-like CYIR protein [Plasmodium cynomolgi strain B]GAB64543.1 KIR-like CYIR protein [Plasmodium cynomolgi strain B]
MSKTRENENLLKDTAVVKALQNEYKFMNYWPDYHFDSLRGIYNSEFESMCGGLKGSSEYINKQNCVKLFSIIDNVIHRGGIKVNDDIWDTIKKLFDENKVNIDLTSNHMIRYINGLAEGLQKGLLDDFKKFKNSYGNYYELDHIAKLFYFSQNLGDIKKIMNSPDNANFASCCEFVNQCLDIYRRIKDLKCSGNSHSKFNPSTLCVEMNSFMEAYKTGLYPDLKYRKLVETNSDAAIYGPINCDYYKPAKKGFLSRYIGYDMEDLSLGSKLTLVSFTVLLGSLGMFMLYKYTPLGKLYGGDKKRRRRTWRRMGHPYEQGLYEEMSSMDSGSEPINYMSHNASQRMRGNTRDASQSMETATTTNTVESTQTLESTSYDSSQKFGNSTYGSSQTLGDSTYGASQTLGGSTYASSQTLGSSTGGASQTLGGSSYGSSQTLGDSIYASSQTLGGSTHGASPNVRSSTREASQTLRNSTYASSQTLGGSTYASSQTLGGSSHGSSQTMGDSTYDSSQSLGSEGFDSSGTLNTMRK